jgi:general secretion pathway protein N
MRTWPLLAGLGCGLVAFLPARLALPAPPLAASAVSGSLWRAELADAQAGGLALGSIGLAAQPAALLKGRLEWQLAGNVSGTMWRSAAAQGADGLTGRITGTALPGLPVRSIDLAGVALALDGAGRCQAASGQMTASLASAIAGQASLTGSPACDGAALLLPLASGDGRLRLDLTVQPGRWQARASIAGASPAEMVALTAAGFRADGAALSHVQEGKW